MPTLRSTGVALCVLLVVGLLAAGCDHGDDAVDNDLEPAHEEPDHPNEVDLDGDDDPVEEGGSHDDEPDGEDEESDAGRGLDGAEDPPDGAPVAVRVEDSPQARPQTGLRRADVVFEAQVEAGMTRLTAVYHTDVPDVVGNVRSARRVDADVLPPFGGVFVHSGARGEVLDRLDAAGVDHRRFDAGADGMWRGEDRPAPHNVYASAQQLQPQSGAHSVESPWRYDDAPGGQEVGRVEVAASPSKPTAWQWRDGQWLREVRGGTHQTTDGPLSVDNVAVLGTSVTTDGCCDTAGNSYVSTRTTGEGPMLLLRDGQALHGTWQRDSTEDHFGFLDEDGQDLPLAPGSVWVQLVEAGALPEVP